MQHASTLVRQARTGPLSYMVREVAAPGQPALPSMFSKKHGPLDAEANRKQVLRMYRKIVRSVPRILLVRKQKQTAEQQKQKDRRKESIALAAPLLRLCPVPVCFSSASAFPPLLLSLFLSPRIL